MERDTVHLSSGPTCHPFPGRILGPNRRPLDGGDELPGEIAAAVPYHAMLWKSDPRGPIERAWMLNAGARLSEIPLAEQHTVMTMVRDGHSFLVGSFDAETVGSVWDGLVAKLRRRNPVVIT